MMTVSVGSAPLSALYHRYYICPRVSTTARAREGVASE